MAALALVEPRAAIQRLNGKPTWLLLVGWLLGWLVGWLKNLKKITWLAKLRLDA
jgi:hypothetical protein